MKESGKLHSADVLPLFAAGCLRKSLKSINGWKSRRRRRKTIPSDSKQLPVPASKERFLRRSLLDDASDGYSQCIVCPWFGFSTFTVRVPAFGPQFSRPPSRVPAVKPLISHPTPSSPRPPLPLLACK
ncbi:hypothetical protein MUK42_34626 [Musa troglodytarum]|uniref:Uncharacterized protein n=1 Tax=Musa troglodytarum TaxID=320322 RepID=A0A9E7FMM7_9LILI|nr:hypothetical protein MUK42_34626 [Musa troglodytarum]